MSFDEMQNNRVYLCGRMASELVFSHEILGEKFYDATIAVERLSGQEDIIPFTISDRLVTNEMLESGNLIGLIGQFRSYNKICDGHSRLVLRVFVREIAEIDEQCPNVIELDGFVCKEPVYRTTPFKREIADLLLAVNRAYNKSDYIPAIAWGRNARYASSFEVGDRIQLVGRIQSRIYQKQLDDGSIEERVAYEVSISRFTAN